MAGENPFEYVRPLPPEQVHGRDELVDRLVRAVGERRLVAVTGPRRFGKTSLLGRVASTAAEVFGIDTVVVDCYGVASVGEFAVRLERALSALQGTARKLARRLLESSELGLSIAPGVGFKASFGRRDAPDPTAVLHGLLAALVELAQRRDGLVLVLDEFQDVGRVDGLDALLRSHLQQARDLAVLFAGSRPSMLRTLFTDRTRPFYGQAEVVEVDRFDPATAATIVEDGFAAAGRDAGDAGVLVARATDGHPQRLMLAAHLLWELVEPGTTATADDAAEALAVARARTDAEHQAVVDGLDRTHRDTLRAVVAYGSPYARAAQRTLGLARGSVQAAVKALEADAMLRRDEDGWALVDPLLTDWIRRRFPLPGT